jgi:RNA polymerase sigma-70 factor (ECF subfamily)
MEFVQTALVDGVVGLVVAQGGRLFRVMRFTIERGKIANVEIVGDPARMETLEVKVLED